MRKTNILFAGHDLKFAKLIMDYLQRTGTYNIKTDEWTGHAAHNERRSKELLQWADIVVCEWGLGNAVWYSHHKRPGQTLVVRMHRQELDTAYPTQFAMDQIDMIIAISPYVYEEFYRVFKIPRHKTAMIYNAVNTAGLDKPKTDDARFHLGIIGILPKMKRLDLAVDILEKLWHRDSRYKLFVKGKMPQELAWLWRKDEEREYYEQLFARIQQAPWKDAVVFESFGSDIDTWLQKIGFVLSTSDFESFHLAPSEGAASGAYPIILKWDGSDTIYPEHYLLPDLAACIERIDDIRQMSASESEKLQEQGKKYVRDNFSIDTVGAQWDALLQRLHRSH